MPAQTLRLTWLAWYACVLACHHGCIRSFCCWSDSHACRPQAATQERVNIGQKARELGYPTDINLLARVRYRLDVILKRTADCFNALTEGELAAYLKKHKRVAHLDARKPRQAIVDTLIQLRLPAPKLYTKSSKSFRRTLYELMTRSVSFDAQRTYA